MKTNWIRTLTLSAAALTMGSAAYAQTRGIVDIPFAFRVNGTQMPAGHYSLETPFASVRNVQLLTDGQHQKFIMGGVGATSEPGAARLVFSCTDKSGCSLVQLWDYNGAGIALPQPKISPAEKERRAVVRLHKSEAE